MIGEAAANNLQILALVIGLVGQSAFLYLYGRVNWYVNYIGRALFNGEVSLWLALVGSLAATLLTSPPYLETWVSPFLTFVHWTVAISIMIKWRAIWRVQNEPKEPSHG